MGPIGQHFLAGFDGPSVTAEARDLILKDKVLGFTLFKWNIENAEQLRGLCDELKALSKQAGYDVLLAVDQEGGRVERLPEPYSRVPSMRRFAEVARAQGSTDILFELGQFLGTEVRAAGFDIDFAPVVDVDNNPDNPIIGDRSFSSDPDEVVRCAGAVARGLMSVGVIPCLKHFPGHGGTHHDSHLELPRDERDATTLQKFDFEPFRQLIAQDLAPTLMTAHVMYPQIDAERPATLSPKFLTEMLRRDWRYDGVLFSDDILMKAVDDHYAREDVCERFFMAGGDAILVCKHPEVTAELIRFFEKKLESSSGGDLRGNFSQAQRRIGTLRQKFSGSAQPRLSFSEFTNRHKQFLAKHFSA